MMPARKLADRHCCFYGLSTADRVHKSLTEPGTPFERDSHYRHRIETEAAPLTWALVANVNPSRPSGPGGAIIKRGTRIFPAGAKVYLSGHHHCIPPVAVVGRSRGGRWVNAIVHVRNLTDWRLRMIYSPAVVRSLFRADAALSLDYRYRQWRGLGCFDVFDRTSDDYRDYLEELGAIIREQTANPWR
jgi:hypothetical protein